MRRLREWESPAKLFRKCRAHDGLVERREQQPEHQPGEDDHDLAVAHDGIVKLAVSETG